MREDDIPLKLLISYVRKLRKGEQEELAKALNLKPDVKTPKRRAAGLRVKGPAPEEINEGVSEEDYARYLRGQGLVWTEEGDTKRTSIQSLTVGKLERFVKFCTERNISFEGNISDDESRCLMGRMQDMLNMSAQYANWLSKSSSRRRGNEAFSKEDIEAEPDMDMGRFQGIFNTMDDE